MNKEKILFKHLNNESIKQDKEPLEKDYLKNRDGRIIMKVVGGAMEEYKDQEQQKLIQWCSENAAKYDAEANDGSSALSNMYSLGKASAMNDVKLFLNEKYEHK